MRNWLVAARQAKRLSQGELADAVDVSRTFITKLETGKSKPSPHVAMKIGETLGVDWTLFFEEQRDYSSRICDE